MNWFINKRFKTDLARMNGEEIILVYVEELRNAIIDKKALDESCDVIRKLVEKANKGRDLRSTLHVSIDYFSTYVRIRVVNACLHRDNFIDIEFVKAERVKRYEPKLFETKKRR